MNVDDEYPKCPVIVDGVKCGEDAENALVFVVEGQKVIVYRCRTHTHPLNNVLVGPGAKVDAR